MRIILASIAALLVGTPVSAQVVNPPIVNVDTSQLATKTEMQSAQQTAADAKAKADAATIAAAAAQTAVDGAVKTVNNVTPNASGAVTLAIPTASSTVPPSVADSGNAGTMTSVYALANHTHASKVRKIRASSAADGSYSWTFATPFTNGTSPICSVTAETAPGVTDVINAQIEGQPTATTAGIRITRTIRSVASLIGLTVLSLPSSPGVTLFHAICIEP